jgi:hypothetical protein
MENAPSASGLSSPSTRGAIMSWVTTEHRGEGAGQIGRPLLIETDNDHARGLLPLLRTLRAEGVITIGAVTRALNERKIPTPRGSRSRVERGQLARACAEARRFTLAPFIDGRYKRPAVYWRTVGLS